MKKGQIILLCSILLISLFAINISASRDFYYRNNFESYSYGNVINYFDIFSQYPQRVNIVPRDRDKSLSINSLSPYNNDGDIHITYNKLFTPAKNEKYIVSWEFEVESCNSSWVKIKKVTPQASSLYLYFNNIKDFLSVEFKVFANKDSCGNGKGQISAFKRTNGKTTSIIPYTSYDFELNKKFKPQVVLERINETDYIMTIYLKNREIVSSSYINIKEIKPGNILLENGGAKTYFDDFTIKRYI
ncbi:hypothetical protein COU57_04780 [Candidatus Pacearchaeota archaeon CG10_big_fil_rev_8_21_14_0_10_32_14]|nr:MAG: hypothetical protein COU57_04780 [Candidatus Pacearchaeota archaeon CG10_big_fil_rev_8_21_14_0_10_32_14]